MRAADRPIMLDRLSVEGCHLPPVMPRHEPWSPAAPVGLVASGVEEDRIDTAAAPGPPRVGGPERPSDECWLEE